MLETAAKAAIPVYAPYSQKGQGAAVLTATGKVFSACTVENANPAVSLSALRGAVSRAVADGEFELRAAVVVDPQGKPQALSPEDLQVLYEFGRGVLVIQKQKDGRPTDTMVTNLLPNPVIRETGLTRAE